MQNTLDRFGQMIKLTALLAEQLNTRGFVLENDRFVLRFDPNAPVDIDQVIGVVRDLMGSLQDSGLIYPWVSSAGTKTHTAEFIQAPVVLTIRITVNAVFATLL